ncbi:MAG: HIT family protein [Patescibacteria group bacterium]|nr:HIT family protein [Patescibacteria group bacterium]
MCIFCKIIAGEIPAHKVYEDDKVLAFLDIKPVHPGHILVLPKKHAANIEEVEEVELSAIILAVKKMGALLKDRLGYEAYNIYQNNGPVAGQTVMHLHFHIIPRVANDNLNHWPVRDYTPGEAEEVLKKLTA